MENIITYKTSLEVKEHLQNLLQEQNTTITELLEKMGYTPWQPWKSEGKQIKIYTINIFGMDYRIDFDGEKPDRFTVEAKSLYSHKIQSGIHVLDFTSKDNIYRITFNTENENQITFTKNKIEKSVKVEDNREFVYKVLKTKIKAIDGAVGLFGYFNGEILNGDNYRTVSIIEKFVG